MVRENRGNFSPWRFFYVDTVVTDVVFVGFRDQNTWNTFPGSEYSNDNNWTVFNHQIIRMFTMHNIYKAMTILK
jgi:hypothetical protein